MEGKVGKGERKKIRKRNKTGSGSIGTELVEEGGRGSTILLTESSAGKSVVEMVLEQRKGVKNNSRRLVTQETRQ